MILCTCGHRNPDDAQFCENAACGNFLEFSGTKIDGDAAASSAPAAEEPASPPPPKVTPPADATAAIPAFQPEPPDAVVDDPEPELPAPSPPQDTPQPPVAPPPSGPPVAPTPQPPPPPLPDFTFKPESEPEPEPPAYTYKPEPEPEPPVPTFKPEEVEPPRPPVHNADPVAEVPPVLPGQYACHRCGAGNDPGKVWCSHCHVELHGGTVDQPVTDEKVPWYRRIFGKKRASGQTTVPAGTRPGRGRDLGREGRSAVMKAKSARSKVLRYAAIAGVCGISVLAVGPFRGTVTDTVDDIRTRLFPDVEPVRPTGVSASSELPGHPASAVIDLAFNTWWSDAAPGTGAGATLTFTFAEPIDPAKIGFHSGARGDTPTDGFPIQPRPRVIEIEYDTGGSDTVELDDVTDFQTFDIGGSDVTTITLTVVSVYPGQAGDDVSLAEVEFFHNT